MQIFDLVTTADRTTKEVLSAKVEEMFNDITLDNVTPLEAVVAITAAEKVLSELKSRFISDAVEYADNNGIKVCRGAEIGIKEAGVKYDYSVCNKWNEMTEQIKAIEDKRKAVEKMLKCATTDAPYIDDTTGEAIVGIPKRSTTTLTVNFK